MNRAQRHPIKSQVVSLPYRANDGRDYLLNLIDTPGHVDFTYEVSRSLASCEGVLLLIDAAQGVQAQTLANLYLAMEYDLAVIPVINKIDLPSADIPRVLDQSPGNGRTPAPLALRQGRNGHPGHLRGHRAADPLPAESGGPLAPYLRRQYDSFRGTVTTAAHGGTGSPATSSLMSGRRVSVESAIRLAGRNGTPCRREVGYVIAGGDVSDVSTGNDHHETACGRAPPGPGANRCFSSSTHRLGRYGD